MKKRSTILYVLSIVLFTVGCKKENSNAFSPVGYWRGTAYLYHTSILNKADGSSRLYLRFPGTDTANAVLKVDGNYTMPVDAFRATYSNGDTDSYLIESNIATDKLISGMLVLATGEAVSFEFRKQP